MLIAYAATVLLWRDPLTDLYARYQQRQLSTELERTFEQYRELAQRRPAVTPGTITAAEAAATAERALASSARRFGRSVEQGDPLGRLEIPKLGLDRVFVHGTRWSSDLSRGPGHYERTSLPGVGKVVAIAGHRTTFGAPLRHIDRLSRGDEITVTMPYGTFLYRVVGHEIVGNSDWSIIRPRRVETLVLSACHPLYSASKRWIVYARLREVTPAAGSSYLVAASGRIAAT